MAGLPPIDYQVLVLAKTLLANVAAAGGAAGAVAGGGAAPAAAAAEHYKGDHMGIAARNAGFRSQTRLQTVFVLSRT